MSDEIINELVMLQQKFIQSDDEQECHELLEKIYHQNKGYFLAFAYKIEYAYWEEGSWFQENMNNYIDEYGLDFPQYLTQDNLDRKYEKVEPAVNMNDYAYKINIFKRKGNFFAIELDKKIEEEIHLVTGNRTTRTYINQYSYLENYLMRRSSLSSLVNQPLIMNEIDNHIKIRLKLYEHLYSKFTIYDNDPSKQNYDSLVIFWENHLDNWNIELETIKNNKIETYHNEREMDKENIEKMNMIQQALGDMMKLIFLVEPTKYVQLMTKMPNLFDCFPWIEHCFKDDFLSFKQEHIDILSSIKTNRDEVIKILFAIDAYIEPIKIKKLNNWREKLNITGLFDTYNKKYKSGISDFYQQSALERTKESLNQKIEYLLSKKILNDNLNHDLEEKTLEIETKKI